MASLDHATLYAVTQALRAIGVTVTFRETDHGELVAVQDPAPVCQRCGHYQWTHSDRRRAWL
jgi:hypothetical protein